MPLFQATPFLPSPIRPLIRTDFSHLPRSPRFQCPLSPSLRNQFHLRSRQALPVPIPRPGGRMRFHYAAAHCATSGSAAVDGDERARVIGFFARCGLGLAAVLIACGLFAIKPQRVFAVEVAGNAVLGLKESSNWPKILQVLTVFKEQGLILAVLLGLSAFFSMAETSITTLWPWKVRELAEKEPENGVFRMLNSDVTRFLTTILIGTTVVNIGATALVTDAATAIFGEAGVTAATGVMTVAILLLTEITPKSVAVHNAQEVARFVVRPIAWLSFVLYPVGRLVTFISMGILKMLGLKGRSEPYVTEDELKLMLRGAEESGTIEEEEQVASCFH